MPVILVVTTLVFGSLVAAGLPLVIGALSIVGSLSLSRCCPMSHRPDCQGVRTRGPNHSEERGWPIDDGGKLRSVG